MSFDDDVRKALANGDAAYDLDREEGVFRQMAGLFRGRMRWMATVATIEAIAFSILLVLAAIEFFQAEETKWQVFYAAAVLLLALMLLLVKIWGWIQMSRYALQREIKRLELRVIEMSGQRDA
ncbi:MAG: DUF6768 family protein [Planctomycetota bacterium]